MPVEETSRRTIHFRLLVRRLRSRYILVLPVATCHRRPPPPPSKNFFGELSGRNQKILPFTRFTRSITPLTTTRHPPLRPHSTAAATLIFTRSDTTPHRTPSPPPFTLHCRHPLSHFISLTLAAMPPPYLLYHRGLATPSPSQHHHHPMSPTARVRLVLTETPQRGVFG
nr:hypothetical protein [Tanacetum cinerariifolium]